MMHLILTAAFVTLATGCSIKQSQEHESQGNLTNSISAEEFLNEINHEIAGHMNKLKLAQWRYSSNLTEENLNEQLRTYTDFAKFTKDVGLRISRFPVDTINGEDLQRQFSMWNFLGSMALPEDAYNEYHRTINMMSSTYSTAKVCDYFNRSKCDLAMEPELTEIFMNNRNPEELKYYWMEWRRVSSKPNKKYYPRYVELTNLVAKMNNFQDAVEYWLNNYEIEHFPVHIESLWQEVKPLYLELHAYVRRKLGEKYGDQLVSSDGPMPAHLLGNMWAHTWTNVADFTVPYPEKHYPNITDVMLKQGYNATTIFRVAEDFFVSLNLSAMPDTFWENSIFEKPKDREIICHASAWDFYDSKDFRIKQCTRINMEDFVTAHHEMGHIQYDLQYKDQPFVYKDGANPAFHEAVGDVVALSASTPSYLKAIGLLSQNQSTDDYEASINQMFLMALEKIAFLPYAYALDKWRWDAFKGVIQPQDYNCKWWSMVEELQGIEPPVARTEEDFDIASKFHVVANVKYIRYFLSYMIQFQFHKALCIEANQYDPEHPERKPFHQCNIYGSKSAGNLLKSMLQVGCSKPWQEVMELMTGQRNISATGIKEYFQPLMDWLKKENSMHNETTLGWVSKNKRCFNTTSEILP